MPEEAITIMTEIFTSEQFTGQPPGPAIRTAAPA
jgi:hypothetical protein